MDAPVRRQLHGNAGDWRVIDDAGDERTVRDLDFRDSHAPMGGDFWQRTGTYHAWQVSETLVLRTMEGRAIAQPGDWVVEGSRGERWPVTDEPVPAHVTPCAGSPPAGPRTDTVTQAPSRPSPFKCPRRAGYLDAGAVHHGEPVGRWRPTAPARQPPDPAERMLAAIRH